MNAKKILNSALILLVFLFYPACKKAPWEVACDGVSEITMTESVNHQSGKSTFQKGESLTYTVKTSPDGCGGGYFDIEIRFYCGTHQLEDIMIQSNGLWIDQAASSTFEVVSAEVTRIEVSVFPEDERGNPLKNEDFVP